MCDDYQHNLPQMRKEKSALIHEIHKQNSVLYFTYGSHSRYFPILLKTMIVSDV